MDFILYILLGVLLLVVVWSIVMHFYTKRYYPEYYSLTWEEQGWYLNYAKRFPHSTHQQRINYAREYRYYPEGN